MTTNSPRRTMDISARWLQVAILTFIFGFGVLGLLARLIYSEHPPIPNKVVSENGTVLYTGRDVMEGQQLFQKYGLMEFGSIFGHGAYLGPDFTAQYLHQSALAATQYYGRDGMTAADIQTRVKNEFKHNRYDSRTETLVYPPGQAYGFNKLKEYYRGWFGPASTQKGLQRPCISDPKDIHRLSSYFAWAAWTSTVTRPGTNYSYTNNWPYEPLAGNIPTAQAFVWSALSLISLLGGIGLMLFIFGRYNTLGWHHSADDPAEPRLRLRAPEKVRLSPSQRTTAWYFLLVAGLFLVQGLLGGVNAHYHAEPGAFYGVNVAQWLPYNLSRMWHVQLAIFFVSVSFLAIGIFIAPMIARREPKHQDKLSILLFVAVVIVAVGSLLGEAASLKDYIKTSGPWFWIGSQGWEYLDLGRLWQVLLTVGMIIWVVILVRGLRSRLAGEHPGNLPYLLLYSAISIPAFYAVGMIFGKVTHFAVMDFWRFWVVHLWVEEFLELFTTIVVAYIFVLMGVVTQKTATRVVYLDIIIYSIGGVIGTMHHLYFSGAPAVHMALGAFFSAMEVIPLMLLTIEAWRFIQLGRKRSEGHSDSASSSDFPHKWAVMFLIAVGFWNFLGAGVFGFLINLPIVSYYEIGTQFTANHAHGAMMGVYGMLAIGFLMFAARYFITPDRKSEMAMKLSFWSLNIGLIWMTLANLVPIGIIQLFDSFQYGYWHAREPQFFSQRIVQAFEWPRLPGDMLFIVGGILPVVYIAWRMFLGRKRYIQQFEGPEMEELSQVYEES
ncbi:MAG: nitric-oxide reductase large subunit [Armatimonadota bacterium]